MKTRIVFKIHTETELPQNFIDSMPRQGQADETCETLLKEYDIDVSLEDSTKYLKSLGAWDNEELTDLELNKMRLIWIACLDCQENETNRFYMGE